MDIRQVINRLKTIRCWTQNGSMARIMLDELIEYLQRSIPR